MPIDIPRRRYCHHLYALFGYLALSLAMTWPLATQWATAIPGDGFDGWQNYWNLWWVKEALLRLHTNPFFTDYLYYPTGVSLYFHTLNIFNGLTTLPVQLVWGLFPAYNAVVLFSFVVAGYGTYLLALWVLGEGQIAGGRLQRADCKRLAAFVAGLVYAFSPYHFAHLLGHMQMFSLEWLPFYVLALLRATNKRQEARGNSLLVPLFLVLTTLCDWYYTWYLLLFTALYVGWLAVTRRLARRTVAVLAGMGLLFGVVMSPLLVPMVREAGRASYMVPPPDQVVRLSADLLAYVTPNEMHPLWGGWARERSDRFTSSTSERMVFAGYVPLALAAVAVWKRRRAAGLWLLSLLTFFVLSLGPVLHVGGRAVFAPLPYALLNRLPFVNITRSVSRFDVMVMLSLAVLVAIGLRELMDWAGGGRRPLVIAALAGALICFEFLAVPYPMSPPDTPAFYRELAREPGDFAVLNLPMEWDRPNALLYQTVHGKRLTTAYTSRDNPLSVVERTPVLQHFRYLGPDIIAQDVGAVGLTVLSHYDVRYVVVDLYQMPAGREREVTLRLVGEVFGDAAPVYRDERLTVYRVEPPAEPRPFVQLGRGWGPRQVDTAGPWRQVKGQATLRVWSPRPASGELQLVVASPVGPVTLQVLGPDGQTLALFEVASSPQRFVIPEIRLAQGMNVLRLACSKSGGAHTTEECVLVFRQVTVGQMANLSHDPLSSMKRR